MLTQKRKPVAYFFKYDHGLDKDIDGTALVLVSRHPVVQVLRTELFFSMGGATLPFHPLGGFAIPLMLMDNEPSQRTEAVFEAAG